jgi:hypothetical protein
VRFSRPALEPENALNARTYETMFVKALLQNAWNCASVGSSSRGFAIASCIRSRFAGYLGGTCCSRIPRRVNSIGKAELYDLLDSSVIVSEADFSYFNSVCFSTKLYMYPHLSNTSRPGFREMCSFNLVLFKSFTAQGSSLNSLLFFFDDWRVVS